MVDHEDLVKCRAVMSSGSYTMTRVGIKFAHQDSVNDKEVSRFSGRGIVAIKEVKVGLG